MATTPSEPDVPLPLTDRERRILESIGETLAADSPQLGRQLTRRPRRRAGRRGGVIDDAICIVTVLVVLGMFMPRAWFVATVLIVVLTAPALLAARYLPDGDRVAGDGGGKPDGSDTR